MHQPTIEKLHALRLGAMANALTAQLQQPEIDAMPFAERLALLVDIQHSAMLSTALEQRLIPARLETDTCPASGADGADALWVADEEVPSTDTGIDDGVVGVPDQSG